MCGAENKIRGVDKSQVSGAIFQTRNVQEEAEADSRRLVEKDWEASARRCIDINSMVVKDSPFLSSSGRLFNALVGWK
jgi:hypothetical protein